MQEPLNEVDIKNIQALINKATIIGQEAVTVALLQQKLTNMLTPTPEVEVIREEPKKEADGE